MVNVQAAAIKSGTPLTHEELSRQVLGQKKRYLLGFGSGPQPSTRAASRARDKDMEAFALRWRHFVRSDKKIMTS
ncbi:hypothetical protein ACSBR2_024667 [Camellia fascicularis]